MSIETWKAEFYPVEADEVPVEDAAAHSLQKWRGLLPESLERHGVKRATFGAIEDEAERFSVNTQTCALCVHFWEDLIDEEGDDVFAHACGACPLAAVRGGISCDDMRDGERLSPYQMWVDKANPKPMILWLGRAVEKAKSDPALIQSPESATP